MARQYGAPKEKFPGQSQRGAGYSERKDPAPEVKQTDASPPADIVASFHKNAAIDSRAEDIHHTVGPEPSQASPGNHTHNGSDGALLLEAYTITGSKANPTTVLPSVIAALVRLGAKDSTT